MKILIIGLPNSGKTTLARALSRHLPMALHINADVARATINRDLSFSLEDRIENARRLNAIAEMIDSNGYEAITDFICPTATTRAEFKADYVIWMDTIAEGRYADTNRIYEKPADVDHCITSFIEYTPMYLDAMVAEINRVAKVRCQERRAITIPTFGELMEHHKDLKGK